MFVVAEVALSVILLVAAGLLLRSFQALQQVDLGFTTERVLAAYTQYPVGSDEDRRNRITFYADLLDRLRGTPGVSSAAGAAFLPMEKSPGRRETISSRADPDLRVNRASGRKLRFKRSHLISSRPWRFLFAPVGTSSAPIRWNGRRWP